MIFLITGQHLWHRNAKFVSLQGSSSSCAMKTNAIYESCLVILIVVLSLSIIRYASDDSQVLWKKLQETFSKIKMMTFSTENIELCPLKSPFLLGSLIIDESKQLTLEQVEDKLKQKIVNGGKNKPSGCKSRQKIALIIPYR